MTEHKTYDNIAKWLSGNMSLEEERLFQNWLEEAPTHQDLLEEMTAIWTKAAPENHDLSFEKEMAWDTVVKKIDKNAGKREANIKELNPFRMQLLKIAAVFILCITVSLWIFRPSAGTASEIFIVNTIDQSQEHLLPDGSKVWLNKNTRLSYQKSFKKRFVTLEGEAFFEVAPDKKRPFEITTDHSHTRVLGTAFNLRAYPKEKQIELVVTHGKVAFSPVGKTTKKAPVILGKSEAVYYEKNTTKLLKERDTTQNALAWKTGKLEFEDRPLNEILQALERNYPIKFQLEFQQVRNCPGTVDFQRETLEEIVEILEYILATEITQQDTYYLITGKACIEEMEEN